MSTFNFTIRAEDNQGSFADRQFSISVKNTMVERYMFTTAANAYTSSDMINWTKRTGFGGRCIRHANGRWFVFTSVGGGFHSTDGSLWDSFTMTGGSSYSPSSYPVFHGGSWYTVGRPSSSSLISWMKSDVQFGVETNANPWTAIGSTGWQSPPSTPCVAFDNKIFAVTSSAICVLETETSAIQFVNWGSAALSSTASYSIPFKIGEFWYAMLAQINTSTSANKGRLVRSPNGITNWTVIDEITLPNTFTSPSAVLYPSYCNGVVYFTNPHMTTSGSTIVNEPRFSMKGEKLFCEVIPVGANTGGLVAASTVRGTTYLFRYTGGADKTTNFTDITAATDINTAREGASITSFLAIT